MGFSKVASSSALLEMEQHDDALAKIANTNTSRQFELSATDGTEMSHSTLQATTIPSVNRYDLNRISVIGSGKFCNVHLVSGPSSFRSESSSSSVSSDQDTESNDDQSLPARSLYAFKSIDPEKLRSADDLTIATTELATEAKMLSQLDHENIIKLRGISSESFSKSYADGDGYFLVMDVLTETLNDRIQQWRRQKKMKEQGRQSSRGLFIRARRSSKDFLRNSFSKVSFRSARRLSSEEKPRKSKSTGDFNDLLSSQRRMYSRIGETVLGIATGMEYLHSHNIVLRDLKPANIGYDDVIDGSCYSSNEANKLVQSRVKLFDFGMAQKVEECNPDEVCGSLRYMAPEVMAGKGYSLAVDVYSFGVILFEMCSLKVPFADFNAGKRKNKRRNIGNRKQGGGQSNLSHPSSLSLTLAVEKRRIADFYKGISFYGITQMNDDLEKLIPCPSIRNLIEECWDADPKNRPSFQEINQRLLVILNREDAATAKTYSCGASCDYRDNSVVTTENEVYSISDH
ncbi:unnamed protein product [Pseudo-nitzschia multistriata]|uniref:Protein kinase domain-containing protein n=1 Tax=Pseudo-nitzschia multistriata TaxID=183589 RepID=A0A448ZIS5_9STRA|nr:unnamed protein product [Pseudo-nitzschia multistriata]